MPSSNILRTGQCYSPAEDTDSQGRSESKRRKVRKGTHSCWECKRRKMKCIFESSNNAICNGCRRRGSKCISQEFPEEVSCSMHKNDDGTMIVEHLVDPLAKKDGGDSTTPYGSTPSSWAEDGGRTDLGIPTPVSMNSRHSLDLGFYQSYKHATTDNAIHSSSSSQHTPRAAADGTDLHGEHESLSRFLYESLPSREDIEKICKANGRPSVLAYEILTVPYATLDQTGLKKPESLLEIPGPNDHPVLISRHMLKLAVFLRHLHPHLHEDIKGLSEPPQAMMKRLADLAIRLVTTNDDLIGSIEGLESVMIESVYQANVGNLRRSWVACRRAMGVAQLMGLHRSDNRAQYKLLDPKTKYDPQILWFRIVDLDRHLCLLLGLPQGCYDRSMASEALLASDTPTGRLERLHCVIASRILERNESIPSSQDFALTRILDVELQKAGRSLPSKWWLAPTLDATSTDSPALFWDTRRLFAQVIHYNLLNQLHLPYMLRSSSAEHNYEFSRITCVNASREVLSRFIRLRAYNQIAYSCRILDFLALMAAMTLLLAHLDSHHSQANNLLAHQYFSDRAMIEQAQEHMKQVSRLNSDALSAQSADLLRRLLAIELETANSQSHVAERVSVEEAGTQAVLPNQDDDSSVSVHIPYFGIIKIAREGMSKELPNPHGTSRKNLQTPLQEADEPGTHSLEKVRTGNQTDSSWLHKPCGIANVEAATPLDASHDHIQATAVAQEVSDAYTKTQPQLGSSHSSTAPVADGSGITSAPQLHPTLIDPILTCAEYPWLAAGGEDWAFQGVDMAFFESLMRSSGNEVNKDLDWDTWQR